VNGSETLGIGNQKLGSCNLLRGFATLRPCVKVRGNVLGSRGNDKGSRWSAASAATVAVRRRTPGDGPAFTKASAVAYKAMADKPAGKRIRAHAQELITFPRGRKTDWGKKRTFFEDLFRPQINTDVRRQENDFSRKRFVAWLVLGISHFSPLFELDSRWPSVRVFDSQEEVEEMNKQCFFCRGSVERGVPINQV